MKATRWLGFVVAISLVLGGVAWAPDAFAQACGGVGEITATQEGQDVIVSFSVEDMATSSPASFLIERSGGVVIEGGPLSPSCSVWMPEPANQCGCSSFSGSLTEECVPPGSYVYTVSRGSAASSEELGTVAIEVTDSGDECLGSGHGGGDGESCAAAGAKTGAPLLALLAAVLGLGLRRRRRG